jgi:tRNA pseudouridine55 synthase
VKFINYNYPFISFDITVSEGSYIRSIAQVLLERLGEVGTLSYLERLHEGKFVFDDEKALNPLEYLDLEQNTYTGTKEWFELGKKLSIEYFENKEDGKYLIVFDSFFAIIQIQDLEVKYLLNKVMLDD